MMGEPPSEGIKLHIGGWEQREGWKILDAIPGPVVDYVGNCTDLTFLDDHSCCEVYASHVLEHLAYNGELQSTLKGIYRVLKPGASLLVTVPTFEILWGLEDDVSHHKRRYRLPELLKKINQTNLVPSQYFYFNYLLFLPILVTRLLIVTWLRQWKPKAIPI